MPRVIILSNMLEKKHQPLASRGRFSRRLLASFGAAIGLILGTLGIGTAGYHFFADFTWVDSLLNAAMILTGMGPVGFLVTTRAKLFAVVYALFCGCVFLTMIVTVLTPMVHRLLHLFHLEDPDSKRH